MLDEKPVAPGHRRQRQPDGDSKADKTVAPVKIGDTIAKTDFAVKPKELSRRRQEGA